jgi:hypothetical protein
MRLDNAFAMDDKALKMLAKNYILNSGFDSHDW